MNQRQDHGSLGITDECAESGLVHRRATVAQIAEDIHAGYKWKVSEHIYQLVCGTVWPQTGQRTHVDPVSRKHLQ